jgi:hypothetical protein
MKNRITANELTGRAIGSLFFAGFGALWLALALYAREQFGVATLCGVLAVTAVLVSAALRLMRQAKQSPRIPDDPRVGRAFAWINAIQWTAGGIVAFSFARLHMDAYMPSAITAIVGLHLFPLARLFRYAPHYATGAALVAWAAATASFAPVDHMQGITALGTGVILWASAAFTLFMALRAAGGSRELLAC